MKRKHVRGVSLIEALVSAALLCTGVLGMVSLWSFGYRATGMTDDRSVGLHLGRRALETAKQAGFYNVAEGTTTTYHDGAMNSVTVGASLYTLVVGTASTPSWPNNDARRTVTVTVTRTADSALMYRTQTVLVEGGI